MSGYNDVGLKSYGYEGLVQFSTPDGLRCQMDGWNSGRGGPPGLIECWGELPGSPEGAFAVGATNHTSGTFFDRKDGPEPQGTFRLLPPNSKLTITLHEGDYVTCGVDDAGMTACKLGYLDQWGHGFVLAPQGSWTF